LRETGFLVTECGDWPADDALRHYHVVLVRVPDSEQAPMLAARLRAKPCFGRRLLAALVPADTPLPERRAAEASGFDVVIGEACDCRQLAARLLRRLRSRAELRCLLPRLRPAA
jgi:hypothetical protein